MSPTTLITSAVVSVVSGIAFFYRVRQRNKVIDAAVTEALNRNLERARETPSRLDDLVYMTLFLADNILIGSSAGRLSEKEIKRLTPIVRSKLLDL
jgi:hypothetical protein